MGSGAEITLMPLNVCRRSRFSHAMYQRIIAPGSDYPEVADLFRRYIGPRFADAELDRREPVLYYGVYDHACLAWLIDPDIFSCERMCVEVSVAARPGLRRLPRLHQGRIRIRQRSAADRKRPGSGQCGLRYRLRSLG